MPPPNAASTAAPTGQPPPSSPPRNLPPRLVVPPLPPRIHRRLLLTATDSGLLLRPPRGATGEAVSVRWGLRGKVEPVPPPASAPAAGVEVELGGIVGIVRLWDAAYLVVFLPPAKPPTPLFPNDTDPFGPEAEYPANEVFTLADVHAVPLEADRARTTLVNLAALNAKRAPKPPKPTTAAAVGTSTPSKSGLGLKWSLPWTPAESPADSSDDDTDDDDDDDSEDGDTDTDAEYHRSRRTSSIAPEADETPCDLPPSVLATPEARVKKRFSLGWGRFTPRLGKPLTAIKVVAALKVKANVKKAAAGGAEDAEVVREEGDAEGPVEAEAESAKAEASPKHQSPKRKPLFPDESVPPAAPATTDDTPSGPVDAPAATEKEAPAPPPMEASRRELETKILKQITRELGSGEFFYSFDYDLSHTLQYKWHRLASKNASAGLLNQLLKESSPSKTKPFVVPTSPAAAASPADRPSSPKVAEPEMVEPDVHVPLWRRFDRRFFWNEWLARDFVDLGLHAYVLPIAQGWVESSRFTVPQAPSLGEDTAPPDIPVDIVLISRRSRDRAGLRYQRRGIDDDGHVANFVETEMMVRARVMGKTSLFSFVQIRGSIPLKWSQTPWSMKPPPELNQPIEQTFSVATRHFDDLRGRYGPVTIVNLSEQTGKESVVTNGYGELVKSLDRSDLKYVPFDFHAKCHGMKWENISELVNMLDLDQMGYVWSLQGDLLREQRGVFRTNCIDCLDRTNVVQSALARRVLDQMLTQVGIVLDPATCNVEAVFNNIWADNGDMISLCYAHTSALKGDFVRTGKRDLQGMLHDGVSSLSRMFYGAVSDFFAQAVISFMLGHRNLGVFNEFIENLQSSEAAELIKQSRIRAAAIETSAARVLSEGETRIGGWTLLSPVERNTKLSTKLEEKVLLLTRVAVYVVSFNYSLEKVNEFTRIPLQSITSIEKGAYILSSLQEAGRDRTENAGFVISFSPADESRRYSTYSLGNRVPTSPSVRKEDLPTTSPSSVRRSLTSPKATLKSPGLRSRASSRASASSRKGGRADTPTPTVTHSAVDPDGAQFFAFKALPREFAPPASDKDLGADDDDDFDDDDVALEANETCRTTVDRVTRRIKDAVVRINPEVDAAAFVVEKDVVSVADADSNTTVLARMDYAVRRFLWL